MKPEATWSFSCGPHQIDFERIAIEAERALLYSDLPAQCIRVTIAGKYPVTLLRRSAVFGFLVNARPESVKRYNEIVKFDGDTCNCVYNRGGLSLTGYNTGKSSWVILACDFVKEFTGRVETTVEVF